ncbi:hypothetical protein BKA82DRAFT_4211287, partial [Pisolithus tinctorius]
VETFCCTTTTRMQPAPNSRLGLGMRPPLPSYGHGPSISALAQQQQMLHQDNFVRRADIRWYIRRHSQQTTRDTYV